MTTETQKETLGFQAEVKQLLHLMIHSLYSNKEIFLRELISNASDAADKLRFESLSSPELLKEDTDLGIVVTADKEARTITIKDNGIGMNRQEVVDNLGTIAKSGTAQFLENLTGDQKKDNQLIGQFGVGFYSSFIVAERVEVFTRRADSSVAEGVHWDSKGDGEFSISTVEKEDRGTTLVLHLRAEEDEFADDFRLRQLIKKYSDHISVPVKMKKEPLPATDEEGEEQPKAEEVVEFEAVNEAKALWTCARNELKDEDYKEFYKHVSHDFSDPLVWSHNKVEGKLEYTSLLYIPQRAPFDLWNREASRGLKLYVQRVFIMDDAEQFLPLYLRFVKGIVDSNDLSLNVSRELLQSDKAVESMRSALTKRVLDMLAKLAKNDAEKYNGFWKEFGQVLKEGPAEDFSNKEKIAKLFRFASTHDDKEDGLHGLDDYVSRMKEGQNKIYYITADQFLAAKNSPNLEIFRKKGIEVLLMVDRIDEWLISHLNEFDGKQFLDVARGELDLGGVESEEDKKEQEKVSEDAKDLVERIKSKLEDKVSEVRATTRLTDSPACLVVGDNDMGGQMRRIMEAAGQPVPESKPIFEINPNHPLVTKLDNEADEDRFSDLSYILFEQANLAAGGTLNDPGQYVQKMNKLLQDLA